jgi:mono/diheme cytochrome c family protein
MPFGTKRWIIISAVLIFLVAGNAYAQEGGGDPERGADLYLENCVMCHGEDGQGRIGASLAAFPGIDSAAAIRQTITNGIDGTVMPAWGQVNGGPLNDQDILDIAAYVEGVLGGTEPVAPLPEYVPPEIAPLPDIEGDPSQGAIVFAQNCVACHGDQAQGGFGWPLAKPWSGNHPEVYIFDVVSQGIENTLMPAWAQSAGGPLDEQQIDDVTAYILSLDPVEGLVLPEQTVEGPLNANISLLIFAAIATVVVIVVVVYYRKA